MAFESTLYPGEQVIGDHNAAMFADTSWHSEFGRGHVDRNWEDEPYGSAIPGFESSGLRIMSRDEILERAEEKERNRSRLSDIVIAGEVVAKNQGRTNYCWIHAVITAMETIRAVNGLPYVPLSPASAGAIIKSYRNVGGWSTEGMRWVAKHGVAPEALWPQNAIDRRYDNGESREKRMGYLVEESYELRTRDLLATATCVLNNQPCPVGYNWWRHAVCAMDVVVRPGRRIGLRIRNSHGGGLGGFIVLEESKATPDDVCTVRVVTATPGKEYAA